MPEQAVERKLVAILADVGADARTAASEGKLEVVVLRRGAAVRYFTIAIATMCLAGCIGSTGIISTGYPDEFFINEMVAPINGGGVAAQRFAIDEAVDFCREHQRVFVFDHAHPGGDLRYPPTGTSLTFRCVLPGAPVWQRPKALINWPAAER